MIKIEEQINKINNKEIAFGSFALIGATGLIVGMPALSALVIPTLPFLISGLITKHKLNNNKSYALNNSFIGYFYKKAFKKWVNNYFDSSSDLTEKKYKFLCLIAWFSHKRIDVHDVLDSLDNKMENVALELLKKKETKYHLGKLLYKSHLNNDDRLDFADVIEEDSNNYEKLQKAKKIYADFADYGMVGENFRFWSVGELPMLMELQDYQLTPQDIIYIKIHTKKAEEQHKKGFHLPGGDIYLDDKSQAMLEKLIAKINNKEHLKVLKDYLNAVEITVFNSMEENYYPNLIDKKLHYLSLSEKIPPNSDNKSKKEKSTSRNKI